MKKIPVFQNPQLDGNSFFWQAGKTGVLLIHGFTATAIEVKQLAEFFYEKNLTVCAPLLPGHGTSPEDLNNRKYTEWICCIEQSLGTLRQACEQIIVGGESMGAVLSLYLGKAMPGIDALLLYSPALNTHKLRYAKYLKLIKPTIYKNNYEENTLWQGYTVYPLNAADELYKLQKLVKRELNKIHQPTIIFQGAYDQSIDADNGDFIYRNIRSKIKKYLRMNESGHVMLLGREFNKIANETWKFLKNSNVLKDSQGL